jgi:hypothetical protein
MSGETGLLARLRSWLGSLVGGTAEEAEGERERERGADAGESDEPPATHVCTVCGTDVVDPEGGCPLCGSTDVRERDSPAGESAGPVPSETATESTVDDEAARLRDLRGGGGEAEDASAE